MAWIIVILVILLLSTAVVALSFQRNATNLMKKFQDSEARRTEASSFLDRFSASILSADGIDGTMHMIAKHIADETDAMSVAIYELSNGELRAIGLHGAYPLVHDASNADSTDLHHQFEVLRRERISPGQGFLGKVMQSLAPELIPDASVDPRFLEYPTYATLGSVIVTPLIEDLSLTGMVCACTARQGNGLPFSQGQLDRLNELTGQVKMAQNLVKTYSEATRRERIDQELEFARRLQTALLPSSFPAWDQFSIDAVSWSAKEVNGDFYDFVEIDQNRLLVIIGDACGKGIPACMLTAMTRSFVRSLTDNFTTLTDFLNQVNTKLYRDTDADRFITLGCCLLDRKYSLIEFGRAGHTDLVSYANNHLQIISPDGTALGILPSEYASFDTICLAFQPRTTIMMFSDGLTEALNNNAEEFGINRLTDTFQKACDQGGSPRTIIERILSTVKNFEKEQNDDQTLVLIRHTGNISA